MDRAARRLVHPSTLLLTAVLVAAPISSSVAEPEPAATPPVSGKRSSRSKDDARGAEAKAPTNVILCRGPRGAVYARDEAEGCRYARLTPENLIDFGAGTDCLLRRAQSAADESGKKDLRDCDDVCSTLDDGRSCVVAVQRSASGSWETFPPDRQFSPGDPALRDALAVCCKR